MKIKSFLIGAAAALMMCTGVFGADPVLSIEGADYDVYGYRIEDSNSNYEIQSLMQILLFCCL